MNDDVARATVQQLNADALSKLQQEHGLRIPAGTYAGWRPTTPTYGEVRGCPVGVTCVATNGMLAGFVPITQEGHNLGKAFIGHVEWFEWEDGETEDGDVIVKRGAPPTLYSIAGGSATQLKRPRSVNPLKPKSKKQEKLEMLLAL